MKHLFTTLAAIAILAGCKETPVNPLTPMGVYPIGVYTLDYNGHEYLWVRDGGIIHSESCPCWDAYKTDEIIYE